VKGAFTDAAKARRGSFEQANGGMLFLDEIGDMSLTAQAKVLRAIQEGEILPVGGEEPVLVDTRIVCATHKDLRAEIAAGRFREDLYYRIAVLELAAPALREHREDVDELARDKLRTATSGMAKQIEGFTPAALAALRSYHWPGNVRELRNEVERAAIHANSTHIDLCDLSARVRGGANGGPGTPLPASLAARYMAMDETERQLVEEALRTAGGNVAEAARLLGITRVMMKRRMDRYGDGGSNGQAA
jgi:Nif-specific regulatory protein